MFPASTQLKYDSHHDRNTDDSFVPCDSTVKTKKLLSFHCTLLFESQLTHILYNVSIAQTDSKQDLKILMKTDCAAEPLKSSKPFVPISADY